MPGPLVIPAIAAGASILGDVVGGLFQGGANRRSINFAKEMYGWQRRDALADWEMQTKYNSPIEQMARLRDAKLNPNLVYGDSVVQSAPSVRSSSAPGANIKAPEIRSGAGVGAALMSYYDVKLKEAQTNNVMSATTVNLEEQQLKRAQTYATIKAAGKTDIETQHIMNSLHRQKEIIDLSVDAKKLEMEKVAAETSRIGAEKQVLLNRDEREAIAQVWTIREAVERILTMRMNRSKTEVEKEEIREKIKLIKEDIKIRQDDVELRKRGIYPGSPAWYKTVEKFVSGVGVLGEDASGTPRGSSKFNRLNLFR